MPTERSSITLLGNHITRTLFIGIEKVIRFRTLLLLRMQIQRTSTEQETTIYFEFVINTESIKSFRTKLFWIEEEEHHILS